ncbi:MAG: hypothetical protein ACFBSG_15595 [Leptolyngbyaceae cyanobacterium]
MNKFAFIGSASLLSLVVAGVATSRHSTATYLPDEAALSSSWVATEQTPIQNTLFQQLFAAAESLTVLPQMKRAIATSNPEIVPAETVFTDSEVRLTGVGPLRIGMTLEEATDALGLPLLPIGSNLGGDCAYYQPDSVSQALGLMVVDNRVIRVDVWPGSSLKTVSGAKIGTTESELEELYPEQIEALPNPYTQGQVLTLTPTDPELALYRLVFETDSTGKVVQFRACQFPAVTWPDGCA